MSVNIDVEIQRKMEKVDGGWLCGDCGYFSNKKTNLYKHVESKHVEAQYYNCEMCGKVLRGINSYNVHIYTHHKSSNLKNWIIL